DQMNAAQQAARQPGMKIGIMSDRAVGVHPDASELWCKPERFANGATVPAPHYMLNHQGQNWRKPTFRPLSLKQNCNKEYP
ncbi:4-alpha-glucanotransferase, partial [Bifidobacterium animalis]|uniref:4-alpha-glucanotransferase n=1 Tax=Bifidobacterium animalis TaxID=28025 RepID=UPI0030E8E345